MPNIEEMPREAYDRILRDIAGGHPLVGARAMGARWAAERTVSEEIHDTLGGLLLFGDALHQFYSDTVSELAKQLTPATPRLEQLFLQWHMLSLNRFYTAYDLLKKGYYFESASLSRTLWEIALTLTGLKKNIVTFEQLFGGRAIPGTPIDVSKALKMVKAADYKIQQHLLWKNPCMDSTNKSHLKDLNGLFNQATHKCNLGLGHLIDLQGRGQPLPTLPVFLRDHVTVAWNLLFMATWGLMATLPYHESLLPPPGASWHDRYTKLLHMYKYSGQGSPSEVVKGFQEITEKVFVLSSSDERPLVGT